MKYIIPCFYGFMVADIRSDVTVIFMPLYVGIFLLWFLCFIFLIFWLWYILERFFSGHDCLGFGRLPLFGWMSVFLDSGNTRLTLHWLGCLRHLISYHPLLLSCVDLGYSLEYAGIHLRSSEVLSHDQTQELTSMIRLAS